MRAAARLAARGAIARQLAYWSIDAVVNRRRAKEYDAARVRWEATKIVLASERTLAREKKPLAYRAFVTELARAGDLGAQRALDALVAPTRQRNEHVPQRDLRPVTLAEIRLRLNVIRAEEDGHYQRARLERQHLQQVAPPRALDEALVAERRRIHELAAEATRYTDAERVRLTQLAREKRSWNPLTRRAATREEEQLCGEQRSRYEKALAVATHEFEQRDLPELENSLPVKNVSTGATSPRRWAWSGKGITHVPLVTRCRESSSDSMPSSVPTSRASTATLRWAVHVSTTLLRRSSGTIKLCRTRFGAMLSTAFVKSSVHVTP